MTEIFKLFGTITVNGLEGVKSGLKSVESQAVKLDKALTKFGRQASKVGTDLAKNVTAPMVAMGAAIGVMAGKTADYADNLLDLADITGLSTKTLQEFENVARTAGVDFDGFLKSIEKFSGKIQEVANGTGSGAVAMRKLGISVKDSEGNLRSMDDLFPEVISALQKVENVTERNAMAQDIFGGKLGDLAPVLAMTTDELAAARKEANDLGLVMSGEALNAANDYKIATQKLTAQITALWRNLAVDLIPVIRDELFPIVQNTIIPALQAAGNTVRRLAEWFRGLDETTQQNIVRFAAFAAIFPILTLGIGKAILSVKAIITAFTLARTAVTALTISMAANPFTAIILGAGAVVAALWGAKKAYDDLIKSSQEYTLQTVDQAEKMKVAAGWDAFAKKLSAVAGSMKSLEEISPELQTELDDLTAAAREQGYAIEGNNDEKVRALNLIALEIKGVRDATGQLVRYTAAKKQSTKAIRSETDDQAQFRQEYEAKIIASNARVERSDKLKLESDIRLNELSRQAAIKSAKEKGFSTSAVNKYYDQEKLNLQTEYNRRVEERERDLNNRLLNAKTELQIAETDSMARKLYLQLTMIENAKQEEIRKAREAGQETLAIEQTYEVEKDKLRQQFARSEEEIQRNLDARLLAQNGTKASQLEFARRQELRDAEGNAAAIADINEYYDQEILKSKYDLVGQIASIFQNIGSQIAGLFTKASANRIQEIDNWETREIRAIEKTTDSEKTKQKKIEAIRKQAEEKRRAEKTKAAKSQKDADIFASITGTAVAVVQALGSAPPPFNFILAGIVGALGAAQTALIAAQPIPEFGEGGIVQPTTGGVLARVAEAGQAEAIIPLKTGVTSIVDEFMNRLAGAAEGLPALAGAGGGRAAGPAVTHVWHIGTLVADDRGIKELERRQSQFRIQEAQRKGG